MIKIKRTKAPKFLSENKKTWTKNYILGSKFNWHAKQNQILKHLKFMTLSHCAFCDDTLIPKGSAKGQIEHFRPKEKYKYYAYAWANLYPICSHCNTSKKDRFDRLLLRPDEIKYEFIDWFRLDLITFEIKPVFQEKINMKRSKQTIKLYGFNKIDKINRRRYVYNEIINNKYSNKNEQPFRFI